MIDPHAGDPTEEEQEWGRWIHAHAVYPDGRRPPVEPPLPSAGRMARSLIQTGTAVLGGLIHGRPLFASESLRDARLRVCQEGAGLNPDQVAGGHCDRYRPSDDRCAGMQGCGCYVAQKAALLASQCPIGRWPNND